eukprot:gene1560-32942_t
MGAAGWLLLGTADVISVGGGSGRSSHVQYHWLQPQRGRPHKCQGMYSSMGFSYGGEGLATQAASTSSDSDSDDNSDESEEAEGSEEERETEEERMDPLEAEGSDDEREAEEKRMDPLEAEGSDEEQDAEDEQMDPLAEGSDEEQEAEEERMDPLEAEGSDEEQEAEDEHMDRLAMERYGMEDFCYCVHKAAKQEGEQEALMRRQPRRRSGRKKAMLRAKRMKGTAAAEPKEWRDAQLAYSGGVPGNSAAAAAGARHVGGAQRAGSPEGLRGGRSKSRSRSRSPGRRDEEHMLEGLDRDPAVAGPHCFPTHLAPIHGVKASDIDRRSEREKERDRRDRDRDRSGRGRSRSRSKERYGRDRGRSRSRSRGRYRRRSRSRSRSWGRSRSRSGDRGGRGRRGRSRSSSRDKKKGGVNTAPDSRAKAPANKPPPASSLGAAPSAPVETPQERLKRIMQAQLNKQAQKDVVVTEKKKLQVGDWDG